MTGSTMTGGQSLPSLFALFILASWLQGDVEECEAANVCRGYFTFKVKAFLSHLSYSTVFLSR